MADSTENSPNRRATLKYSREQFDDYLVALLARIRFNDNADRILSGESRHPLLNYQTQHAAALHRLNIVPFSAQQLIEDPLGSYILFTRSLASALSVFPHDVPDVGNLGTLDRLYEVHKAAQRFIYDVIVRTRTSMHALRPRCQVWGRPPSA